MISLPLFKRSIKSGLRLSVIFIAVLAMYTSVIIYMFDPEMAKMLEQYQEMLPGMMEAFGMTGNTGTLTAFIQTYLYGFFMLVIPMIFEIMLVNKFVMHYIDSGSMASILATPNSRKKIILTQMLAIWVCIIFLISVTVVIGIGCSQMMFPGELDIPTYLMLNVNMFLIHFVISGIGFCAACFFNETKGYLAVGAGVPIGFYLIQMLSNMGEKLDWMKYLTLYSLFSGEEIISGSGGVLASNLILIGLGICFYALGVIKIIKKDLCL